MHVYVILWDQTPPNTPQRARIAAQRNEHDNRVLDSPQRHRVPQSRPLNAPVPQQPLNDVFGGGPIQAPLGDQGLHPRNVVQQLTPNRARARLAQLQTPLEFDPAPRPQQDPDILAQVQEHVAQFNIHRGNAVAGPSNQQAPQLPQAMVAAMQQRITELNAPRQFQGLGQDPNILAQVQTRLAEFPQFNTGNRQCNSEYRNLMSLGNIEQGPVRRRRMNAVPGPVQQPNNPAPQVQIQQNPPVHPPNILLQIQPLPNPLAQQDLDQQPPAQQGAQQDPDPDFPQAIPVAELPKYFKPVTEARVQCIDLGPMNVICPKCQLYSCLRIATSEVDVEAQGLCNGSRGILTKMSPHVLEIRLIGGEHAGKTAFIPRITIIPSAEEIGIDMRRRQFPVRLAFVMTINKAQGQSVTTVGLDLRTDVFAHDVILFFSWKWEQSTNVAKPPGFGAEPQQAVERAGEAAGSGASSRAEGTRDLFFGNLKESGDGLR
ncbi:hypothetical protein C8F04DRAFT_1238363 [Mycena alexandri]|uniref:ATP-dependent DNA helicase n=1 Tax=Mycena alexandri TaxID=1745969 RepID=A0AAD6SGZ1_9AGAR|nr:hypothetical protein C8F04DRAFT_1238363 [Mycena alexandri]